jgi:hypothetical protein
MTSEVVKPAHKTEVISWERAVELAFELENPIRHDLGVGDQTEGIHPDFGPVIITTTVSERATLIRL